MCFLTGIASGNLVNDIYFKDEAKNSITLTILDGNPVSEEIEKVLDNHKYIKDYIFNYSIGQENKTLINSIIPDEYGNLINISNKNIIHPVAPP